MATMDEVATRAGVSKSSVSRAFSRPEAVRPDTRQRILAVAAELRYAPHRASRPTGRGRTGSLGLFVPDIANPFFPPIIRAAQGEARRLGFTVFTIDSEEHLEEEFPAVRAMAEQVDGLVVASPRMSDAELIKLQEIVPLVLINRDVDDVPAVLLSAKTGMTQAVEHLVALRHHQLVYLSGPEASFSTADRRACLRAAADRAEVDVLELGPFEPTYAAGLRAGDLFLATGRSAVLAYNDLIALGLMTQLAERGVQVGDQVSVIGFDDTWLAPLASPPLTTVRVPGATAGAAAVRRLAGLVGGDPPDEAAFRLESELIIRSSTAPLRR